MVKTRDMRQWVKEQTDLAVIYAIDGAYASAARVLRDLATDCQKHADMIKAMEDGEANKGGSLSRL